MSLLLLQQPRVQLSRLVCADNLSRYGICGNCWHVSSFGFRWAVPGCCNRFTKENTCCVFTDVVSAHVISAAEMPVEPKCLQKVTKAPREREREGRKRDGWQVTGRGSGVGFVCGCFWWWWCPVMVWEGSRKVTLQCHVMLLTRHAMSSLCLVATRHSTRLVVCDENLRHRTTPRSCYVMGWMRVTHHLAFVVSSYVMALVCHTISLRSCVTLRHDTPAYVYLRHGSHVGHQWIPFILGKSGKCVWEREREEGEGEVFVQDCWVCRSYFPPPHSFPFLPPPTNPFNSSVVWFRKRRHIALHARHLVDCSGD